MDTVSDVEELASQDLTTLTVEAAIICFGSYLFVGIHVMFLYTIIPGRREKKDG